jgi:hypothetical protein
MTSITGGNLRDDAGNLLVSQATEYFMRVGFGQVPGHTRVAALGRANSVAAAPFDIWNSTASTYPWMTAATALEVVSSSAQDAPAGTGIQSIVINGLDATYTQVAQTITLNGTTAVAIPTSLFRINNALTLVKGSGAAATGVTNAGDITIRDSGGGTTRALISAGQGITQQTAYTVPAGKTLQIISQVFSVDNPSANKDFTISTYIQSSLGVFRLPLHISVDGNPYRHDGIPGIILAEKTDFLHRITFISGINNSYTSAWLGILKENTAQ